MIVKDKEQKNIKRTTQTQPRFQEPEVYANSQKIAYLLRCLVGILSKRSAVKKQRTVEMYYGPYPAMQ